MVHISLSTQLGFIAATMTTLLLAGLILYRYYNGRFTSFILSLGLLVAWLFATAIVASSGFLYDSAAIPPRLVFFTVPALLFVIYLAYSSKLSPFSDSINIKALTAFHFVRILVELALSSLNQQGAIPEVMTYDGRNFDIISGFTAPIITLVCFSKNELIRPKLLLLWNVICLLLLINIVIHAVLSLPTPFQQFGFDHPNVAVLQYPFVWLPTFVVPLVLAAHLISIRRLLKH